MKYKIEVTDKDIALGFKGSTSHCPVALACRRSMNWDYWCISSWEASEMTEGGEVVLRRFLLPGEASQFIYDFDYGKEVFPLAFEIDDAQEISADQFSVS